MSSSLTLSASAAVPSPGMSLVEVLEQVPDPRARRGVRHRLSVVLAVGVTAVIAGARSFTAIAEWAADTSADVLAGLGIIDGRVPEVSTIRRLFTRVDAEALDRLLGRGWTHTVVREGRRVIAPDGKTVRGACTATTTAPHLVGALDHTAGVVLGQVAVAAKLNEIPAVRELLATFDLTATVITVDALCRYLHKASYAEVVVMPS